MLKAIQALSVSLLLNSGFVHSSREIIAIAPNEQRDAHYERNQPFTRHAREITNEKELFDRDIAPFEIVIDSGDDFAVDDVKKATEACLKSKLMEEFDSIKKVSLGDITIKSIGARLLNRSNERLLNTGRTQIDVEGGKVTFYDIILNKPPDEELNEAVYNVLESDLNKEDIFKGVTVSVTADIPSTIPSITPVLIAPNPKVVVTESADFFDKDNTNHAATITFSVLAVLCVVILSAFFVKRRYGIQIPNFRSRAHNDNEESSSSPGLMKRDLDFEQFVVECCTDNDVFENDDQFFSPKSEAPLQFDPESAKNDFV